MNWNCTLTEERLSDFLEGALPSEEAAAFSAHQAECASCARLVAGVGGLIRRMQQAPPVEVPAQLERKILDATLGPRKQRRAPQGWSGWLALIWQPRFAMGIVTVAASVLIVVHAAASEGVRATLNPVNLLRGADRQIHLSYARGARFVNNLRVVYEIQSRLSPPPESFSEPIIPPATQPSIEPQPGRQPAEQPRQKTQAIPRPNRRGLRSGPELAEMTPGFEFDSSLMHSASRSLL